jgi:hypothetical protein
MDGTLLNSHNLITQDVNKGLALGYLTKYLGMSPSKVVAMGDNPNDREMLEIAGLGIAVANAHADLKKMATFCSGYNDQHAVAEVVEWLESGYLQRVLRGEEI